MSKRRLSGSPASICVSPVALDDQKIIDKHNVLAAYLAAWNRDPALAEPWIKEQVAAAYGNRVTVDAVVDGSLCVVVTVQPEVEFDWGRVLGTAPNAVAVEVETQTLLTKAGVEEVEETVVSPHWVADASQTVGLNLPKQITVSRVSRQWRTPQCAYKLSSGRQCGNHTKDGECWRHKHLVE